MAEVALIYLPAGEGGTKQGVDDFLAAAHSIDDLLALATAELREPPRDEEDEEAPLMPYRETPYGLVWDKPTQNGTVPTPLTNFRARIIGDVVEDDGAEESRSFEIEAELNGRHSVFTLPSERFSGMGWVPEQLGASAIVYPGHGAKDHTRAATQMLSGEIPVRHVYTHTGWREIDGEWVYLSAGGPIGSFGSLTEIEVSLGEGRLGDYSLPEPPEGDELRRAIRTSLRFLELAPLRVTVPLLAAIFRAILGEMLSVDLSVFVAGPTGVLKTEVTAIAQAHYGPAFNGRNLPANWSSTENALEKQTFAAKDALLTVDDFAPAGTNYDVQRLHRTADRLLRAQGNRAGRGRMRADTTLRAVYYPRGLILASGEDVPRGQSLRSRIAVLELSPGDVDLAVLTELQQAAAEGLMASTMSGYLAWLSPQVEDLKDRLPERHRELRVEAAGLGTHARTPDMVASLGLAMRGFLKFAVETGAISDARAEEIWVEGWEALGEMAEAQSEHQAGEEPTQQFLELLTSAIVGGYAHVADAERGEAPEDAKLWGWRLKTIGVGENERVEWQPQGSRIGWLSDDGSVLLEPGVAFAIAQKVAREQGISLPIKQRTLWKRMAEKGLLASRDTVRGRNTTRAAVAGERKTVVHLIAGLLSQNGPNDPNDPSSGRRADSGPKERDLSPSPGVETTREDDLESPRNGASGPKGSFGSFPGGGPTEKVEQSAYRLTDGEAQLIDTQAGVQELLLKLRETECFGLDIETTGLDPRKHKVRLLTLFTEGSTWAIDCFKVDPNPLFPVLAQKKLVIHNALFDLAFLSQMGFEVGEGGGVFDTMITSQLLGVGDAEGKEYV
jgi:hypothetical protein